MAVSVRDSDREIGFALMIFFLGTHECIIAHTEYAHVPIAWWDGLDKAAA